MLELACGAGRITIPVFQSGVDIDGLDFSPKALSVARRRAREQSLSINFMEGDIRSFPFEKRYDFIFLPAGTVSHLISREEIEKFLACTRKALQPGGVLALHLHNPFNTFFRSWPLNAATDHSTFELCATKEVVRLDTSVGYAQDTQIFSVKYHYTFPDNSIRDTVIVLKMYFPAEMQTLLHHNDFKVLHIFGDYTRKSFCSGCKKYIILVTPLN